MGMELDWYSKKTIISCAPTRKMPTFSTMVFIVRHCLRKSLLRRVGPVVYFPPLENSPVPKKPELSGPYTHSMSKRNWMSRIDNRFRRKERHSCFGCVLHI